MNPNFSNAVFIKSCLEEKDFPALYSQRHTQYPEIAIIGRSNSGKSSLINHLTQKHKLVYVSSTPGKTQLINFFNIDEKLLLVDLPGYGFAKVNKAMKKTWGRTLSNYLENRPQLSLLILMLDLRRDISDDDMQMISWAKSLGKQILFVFSKYDKFTKIDRKNAENRLLASLTDLLQEEPALYLSYSIKENQCRLLLKNLIISALDTKGNYGTA
jgi:GTP-binding protein